MRNVDAGLGHRGQSSTGISCCDWELQVIGNHESIDVFIGLDVGKGEHHAAVAADRAGKKLFNKALPNDELRLREILNSLKARPRSAGR